MRDMMLRVGVLLVTLVLSLTACSPPPRTLKICRARAVADARGKGLAPEDAGELFEPNGDKTVIKKEAE
jgi:starvation-inducible outer membrane lipoprotein